MSGLQWGVAVLSVHVGADSLWVLTSPFLSTLRGAGWKRSCSLVPLVSSTGVAPSPGACPSPLTPPCGWLSAGQRSQEGLWPFLLGLYSFHTGLLDFPPGCRRLGLLNSPQGGPRGVPLYRKPTGRHALSEGPSALGGTWGRHPACGVSERLFTGSSLLQTCSTYLRQRGMDSRRILAHLRASTHKAGRGLPEQVKTPQSAPRGDESPCILLFAVPVEGAEVVASPPLSGQLLGRPHALPSLRPWGAGGVSCRTTLRWPAHLVNVPAAS